MGWTVTPTMLVIYLVRAAGLGLFGSVVIRSGPIYRKQSALMFVGPEGRIRDFNPTAGRLFEGLAVDEPAGDVLPEEVQVRVIDDGPGILETERRPLRTRGETNLNHTSGLDLWLVKWAVSLSAGEIAFEDRDPCGSVVTLSLPAATV